MSTTMRERYWHMWAELLRHESYYRNYQSFSRIANAVLTTVCSFAAAASIASWGIWGAIPLAWSVITAFSQFIQVANPVLPFAKQSAALRYYFQDYAKLLIVVEHEWNRIDNYDEEEINDRIKLYQEESANIENRYIGNTWFPVINRLLIKAERERDQALKYKSL